MSLAILRPVEVADTIAEILAEVVAGKLIKVILPTLEIKVALT